MHGHNTAQNSSNNYIRLHITTAISENCYILAVLLWLAYGIGQAIIYLPCGFYLLLLSFFSSTILTSRRLNVYHTSTHGLALVQI